MKLSIYAVRDNKAGVFNTPFFVKNIHDAQRSFIRICNDQNTTLNQFPEDFDLMYVGEYDDETAVIQSVANGEHVMTAKSAIREGKKEVQNESLPTNRKE